MRGRGVSQDGRRAAAVLLARCAERGGPRGRFHALLHEGAERLSARDGRVAGVVTAARTCAHARAPTNRGAPRQSRRLRGDRQSRFVRQPPCAGATRSRAFPSLAQARC